MKSLRIYVAGKYTDDDKDVRDNNIAVARLHTAMLIKAGHYPFCPHTMTAHFDDDFPEIEYKHYMAMFCEWLRFCDAIYLLPNWQLSNGAGIEIELANELKLDVYYDLKQVPQVDGFPTMAEIATAHLTKECHDMKRIVSHKNGFGDVVLYP